MTKHAIIIGAGPAGLTAAYELLTKTDILPIIVEESEFIGGISKTINYKGNRIDIGGHRFFSKSKLVMDFWENIMPIQTPSTNTEKTDIILLVRDRLSRILYLHKFFDYPISLNFNTIKNLGFWRLKNMATSYLASRLFPIRDEQSFEDFLINRFGRELYETFFADYTYKVWGVKCADMPKDWGKQRIKSLSITKVLIHALKKIFSSKNDISQRHTETSLIERFLYPKYGPGQMWETVAKKIQSLGGQILLSHQAIKINNKDFKINSITIEDKKTNEQKTLNSDYILSSMPIKNLFTSFTGNIDEKIKNLAQNLQYRDFITVGLLIKKLKIAVPDNWIYIQEKYVKVGRIQVFNNWSPYMVKDKNYTWIGLEYFCNKNDDMWNTPDDEFIKFAISELKQIDFLDDENDVCDATLIRQEKAYPAYFGVYKNFDEIKNYLDNFTNLFCIGRNGMHRYNNQDHSMLTAMTAVGNIKNNMTDKKNIWEINTEEEYHEEEK